MAPVKYPPSVCSKLSLVKSLDFYSYINTWYILICVIRNMPFFLFYFLFYWKGFNKYPFQLLRSYKGHEENKRKIGQERSSMQQVGYHCHRPTPWMQESVSMHKSPIPLRHSRMNQARSEEEEKERKKDRGHEACWKERQPNKTKHIDLRN